MKAFAESQQHTTYFSILVDEALVPSKLNFSKSVADKFTRSQSLKKMFKPKIVLKGPCPEIKSQRSWTNFSGDVLLHSFIHWRKDTTNTNMMQRSPISSAGLGQVDGFIWYRNTACFFCTLPYGFHYMTRMRDDWRGEDGKRGRDKHEGRDSHAAPLFANIMRKISSSIKHQDGYAAMSNIS